uniref:Uncharacterized protein n=2 Tax=Methanosarcina barkeri TaxID=2208 RepID=Q46A80_METBF|nr:F420-reducing hydrogenase isoenzyme I epsilon subunit [Methanosarcina barkeri]
METCGFLGEPASSGGSPLTSSSWEVTGMSTLGSDRADPVY